MGMSPVTRRAVGRKKLAPIVRSMISMVIAEPRTGVAQSTRIAVMKRPQTVSGMRQKVIPARAS